MTENNNPPIIEFSNVAKRFGPLTVLDGFNFSTGGHAVAAENVAPAVRELVEQAGLGAH